MPGLSKVIVLEPDARARRQVQLGFEREGVPTQAVPPDGGFEPGDDAGLVVIGGTDGQGLELVRLARQWLDDHRIDAPIVFAGRGVRRTDAEAAGADEVLLQPAYLRDVVTIGRLLRGLPAGQRAHLVGSLVDVTGVLTLVRALAALGRSATLTLIRGLRRGEVRFYHGEVTSAQVGMIHGQAALHQLLLWTDARFDFHHEDVVRRQQIPLSHDELFADAERFLESVRDASGGLSPSTLLEQDVQRVQALGKQIPTEVHGVLRMFDGHRTVADVLEDSAYRVFETLRVAQRGVEVGLLRPLPRQPSRPAWRAVLAIEDWLVGNEVPDADATDATDAADAASDTAIESGPTAVAKPASAPASPGDIRDRKRKPRRKKKKRVPTLHANPVPPPDNRPPPPPLQIDWGALVPRIVGAEIGSLAGVVPAAHVSGEINASASPAQRSSLDSQPTIMLDDAADVDAESRRTTERLAVQDRRDTGRIRSEPRPAADGDPELRRDTDPMGVRMRPDADRINTERMDTEAILAAARAAVVSPLEANVREGTPDAPAEPQPSLVVDDMALDDTKPERIAGRAIPPSVTPEPAVSEGVQDVVTAETTDATTTRIPTAAGATVANEEIAAEMSDATTAPIAAPPRARAASDGSDAVDVVIDAGPVESPSPDEPPAPPAIAAPEAPTEDPTERIEAAPAPPAISTRAIDSAPSEIVDEPSDGVVRQQITSIDTAPVKRRRLPSDPPDDDRPDDATGEITSRRPRTVEPRHSEPSILVADLAELHAAASEVADEPARRPPSDTASPTRAARISETRLDAVAFSAAEEAFFRDGHDKDAELSAPRAESFDDLDEGYRPVGFWDRLRGRGRRRRPSTPGLGHTQGKLRLDKSKPTPSKK